MKSPARAPAPNGTARRRPETSLVPVKRRSRQAQLASELADANQALRREIDEHERDAAALRAIEQRQALILRSLPMTVYTCESSGEFGITWITENSQRVTGFAPKRFVDSPNFWASRLHPDDRVWVLERFAQLREAGFIAIEYRWLCADHEYHWFLDQAMWVRVKHGERDQIVGTWLDISNRKRLEREILEISERERRRIGQDLHDDLCQQLATIEFLSQALQQNLAESSRDDASRASEIARMARRAITRTRELVRGLSPVELEAAGLMEALKRLASRTQKLYRLACRFSCEPPVLIHDNEVSTHLFRIAQEAVSNALKHGKARRIDVGLAAQNGRIVLTVRDDGVGIPKRVAKNKGMGLLTMHYRAGMIKGAVAVRKLSPCGTEVACSVPLSPAKMTVSRQ